MRGRPKFQMTARRKQVLELLREFAKNEECMTLGEMVRRAGLHDRTVLKRIIADLRSMGHIE